jgi:hypothetical protein
MKKLLLAFALLVTSPFPVWAGEIADHAAAAETAAAAGDGPGAIKEFDAAQDALWTAMPLTIRTVEQVSAASGVGVYTVRADHRYKPDEKLHLYIEPVGYGFGDDGLGNKVINLAVDLTLKSENGEELGTIADLTSIKLSSRVKNRELFFNLNLSLDPSSTPPGKYLADFVVRDQNSDKAAKFSIDFEIAGYTAALAIP